MTGIRSGSGLSAGSIPDAMQRVQEGLGERTGK